MMHPRKLLALLLCAVMLLSVLPMTAAAETSGLQNFKKVNTYNAGTFSDVSTTDWFSDNVKAAYELGLMIGQGENFGADSNLTIAEAVTLAARLHSIYSGNNEDFVPVSPWYQVYVNYVKSHNLVSLHGLNMTAPATRAQFANILAGSLPNTALKNVNNVADDAIPDVKLVDDGAEAVYKLYRAGILVGNDVQGTFAPNSNIKRCEVAAIVTRMADSSLRKAITLGEFYTVTFDLNYPTVIENQVVSVEAGKTVSAPQNPKRGGFAFTGWYTATSGGTKFAFDSKIFSDTLLYAHWSYNPHDRGNTTPTPPATKFTVTYNSNGGSVVSSQTILFGLCATQPENPTRDGYLFVGWYSDNALTIPYDFNAIVTSNIVLYAKWEENLTDNHDDNNNNGVPDSLDLLMNYGTDSYDSDGDNVPDYFESLYGTDKDLVDTDNDGLPDGYELYTLGTNPIKIDSNENGILDGEEDTDSDGLANLFEYQLQTNPRKADTDNDGLTDFREFTIFHTDPLKEDSDADGLRDSDEFTYHMNPLNPITLNDGILDGNRDFTVLVSGDTSDNGIISLSLEINLKGKQIQTLSIKKIDNSDLFLNSSVPGYIGNAYEFNVDGSFSKATLTFELDENLLSADSDPAIYYWNEAAQTLEELDNQTREGNLLRAELSHFSSYIVIDKIRYTNSVLEFEIKAPTSEELQNKTFDVMLVLDESGSISRSNFSLMKLLCLDLLEHLTEEDRIGVITFDESVRTIVGLTDKTEAASVISNLIQHNGSTALYDAINTGIDEISNNSKSTKVIIALTDGKDNKSKISSESVTTKAINGNVIIYTIGVGSNVSKNDLTVIAESTHGQYYAASNFNELSVVFERIIEDSDLYKDSDGDGISDYHEKAILNGNLKAGNGTSISSYVRLNYLSSDSDGDGLLDGAEIEIREKTVNGKSVYYCYMYSNPCVTDSDSDGLDDCAEDYAGFDPLINNLTYKKVSTPLASLLSGHSFGGNSFREWLQLLKDKGAWNAIHNIVETVIRSRNPFLLQREYAITKSGVPLGRVDLLQEFPQGGTSNLIWDVKPASYAVDPLRHAKGIAQLRWYVEIAKFSDGPYRELSIGGAEISSGMILTDSQYEIEYQNTFDGLIVYQFTRRIPILPQPQEQNQEEDEKLPHTQTEWYELLWEGAKAFAYDFSQFSEWLLESVGQSIRDATEEIIAHGREIAEVSSLLAILYVIGHMLPVLVIV